MVLGKPFVYFGTSEFSRRVLQGLLAAGSRPTRIITTEAKPSGRGLRVAPTPVAALAHEHNLPTLEVRTLKSADVQTQLASTTTPVALLAAFGKIVPPSVLALYPRGIVNVHPSLLPSLRGPSPIQYALRDALTETGVTIMLLDKDIDHGPLLAQRKQTIEPNDDAETLGGKLADLAVTLLIETLPRYLRGELTPQPQEHTRATFTKMITREDGQADFLKSASELNATRRAFAPWPGLWTTWQGKRLKLVATSIATDNIGEPGAVARADQSVVISCQTGALVVSELQLEGGTAVSAADFLRGHPTLIGSTLPS